MAPKVKEALSWVSEAVETAAGWAIVFVVAYALLFIDLNGNGRLIDTARAAIQDAMGVAPTSTVAVRTRVVPVRPVDEAKVAQDRMLALPESPDTPITVAVSAPDQSRPADQITDAPAEPRAGKDWRKHLTTQLRTFTVYGRGDESSSASASVKDVPAPASGSAGAVATPSAAGSAYKLGSSTPAQARPGVSSRATPMGERPADGVRNFR